jgi:quinol---cytochrome-c reductase cytochrome b subunit
MPLTSSESDATSERREEGERLVRAVDRRFPVMELGKELLRKAFPDHWSFLLGEVALYSFVILVLTGSFLSMFFDDSMQEHPYQGAWGPLRGVMVSEAYASVLQICFEVRGGQLVRQMHHWSALIFVASITVHLLRIFFTGAFRRPREGNWTIGVTLFGLALLEGFCGYSLPDDLLSGTGLRTADGIVLSLPVIGSYLSFFLVGGQWPGTLLISRLFIFHVLFIPGLLIALITVHLFLVVYLKHTQWPGTERTNRNVQGKPMVPLYTAKSIGLFFAIAAITAVMSSLFQINPVWWWGPYDTAKVSINAQPDWYVGFLEGALRLMPAAESNIAGHTVVWDAFIPGVCVPTVLFLILYSYPFFERWLEGGGKEYHLCDRPRNAPTRTGLGVSFVCAYAVLLFTGSQDVLAYVFRIPVHGITWGMRAAFFVLPAVGFWVTRRACLGLQASDRERLRRGEQSGELQLTPAGGYTESVAPVAQETALLMRSRLRPTAVPPGPKVSLVNLLFRPAATLKKKLRITLHDWYFPVIELPATEEEYQQMLQITADPAEAQQHHEPKKRTWLQRLARLTPRRHRGDG